MSRYYLTQGIVLNRTNINETDVLVTAFTLEKGRFSFLAKGTKKIESSLRAGTEPLTETLFFIIKRRELDLLTECEIISHNRIIKENLRKLSYAFYFLKLLSKFIPAEAPVPEIYYTVKDAFYTLQNIPTQNFASLQTQTNNLFQNTEYKTQNTDSQHESTKAQRHKGTEDFPNNQQLTTNNYLKNNLYYLLKTKFELTLLSQLGYTINIENCTYDKKTHFLWHEDVPTLPDNRSVDTSRCSNNYVNSFDNLIYSLYYQHLGEDIRNCFICLQE